MAGPHRGRQDVIELVSRGEQRELGTAPGVEGAGRVPSQPLGRASGHWTGQWGAGAGLAGHGTWRREFRQQFGGHGIATRGGQWGGGVHTERAGPAPQESQQWGPLLTRGRVEEALRGPDPVSYRGQKTW